MRLDGDALRGVMIVMRPVLWFALRASVNCMPSTKLAG
jgi:hypothetical protein